MSEGSELDLFRMRLNDEDFRQILIGLSNPYRREQPPRKCKRQRCEQGLVREILANLPTNVSGLGVAYNDGIGDAGMMHLHLIPESITELNLNLCGLTPLGIKKLCEFLKSNKTIKRLDIRSNQMGNEGFKDVADMLKVNNTVKELEIESSQILMMWTIAICQKDWRRIVGFANSLWDAMIS
jgi:hypothetical protein